MPNRDFTYVRTGRGLACVSCIVDVFAQRVIAWHSATRKENKPAMAFMHKASWRDSREGRGITPGELPRRANVEPSTLITFTKHLELECIRTNLFHHGPYRLLLDVESTTCIWLC